MHTPGQIQDDTKKAFRTFWSWLRRTGDSAGAGASARMPATDGVTTSDTGPRQPGIVLPFPIRGEALLVKLAELLRRRIAELNSSSDGLTLLLSHTPYLRLSLDDNAYVEFDAQSAEYDLVIEAPSGTRLIIQTTDFDSLVTFVLQYVIERISDSAPLGVAS